MSPSVLVERDGHLAQVILNRPEVLNAIDNALAQEVLETCLGFASDDDVWCVILRGAGERAFCATASIASRQIVSAGRPVSFMWSSACPTRSSSMRNRASVHSASWRLKLSSCR